jgi:hypothetical protein
MADTQNTLAAEARVPTKSARRYLGQLCKHFAHKLPATYEPEFVTGRIEFPAGVCSLDATAPELLVMRVTAANGEDLERLEGVVARHLERFAFRETLTMDWQALA